MIKIGFTTLFLLCSFFALCQEGEEAKIIQAIYPTYSEDLTEEGVAYFDEDQLATLSEVIWNPVGNDITQILVELTWSFQSFIWGNITEYAVLDRQDTSYVLMSAGGELSYGGGTQRYGEPEIIHPYLILSDSCWGFVVELGSHHHASQTVSRELYLLAVTNGKIGIVFQTSSLEFLHFLLKDMKGETVLLEDLMKEESIPNYLKKEDIFETENSFELLSSQTLGMYDILLKEERSFILGNRVVVDVNHHLYRWNGIKYAKFTYPK